MIESLDSIKYLTHSFSFAVLIFSFHFLSTSCPHHHNHHSIIRHLSSSSSSPSTVRPSIHPSMPILVTNTVSNHHHSNQTKISIFQLEWMNITHDSAAASRCECLYWAKTEHFSLTTLIIVFPPNSNTNIISLTHFHSSIQNAQLQMPVVWKPSLPSSPLK